MSSTSMTTSYLPLASTPPRSPCADIAHLPHATRTRLDPGAVLRIGEPDKTAICVENGALAVEVLDPQHGSSIIEVLGAGVCCADALRARTPPRAKSSLVALVPSSVVLVPMNTLLDHVVSSNTTASEFFKAWSDRYRGWTERLTLLRVKSPLRRTAGTLLYLIEQMAQSCPLAPGQRILLTQDVMARIADLSRQTLNRELQRLQAARIVRLGRSMVCVLDMDQLEAVYDGDVAPHGDHPPVPCQLLNPNDPLECHPVMVKARN